MSNLRKLPDFTQLDLFSAEFTDITTRVMQDVMWRPFFALSNKPRLKPIVYSNDSVKIEIVGSVEGMATIFDADVLMWFISQIVEAKDRGEPPSPQIDFYPYDCLRGIRRDTGGRQYELLMKSLRRLHGTVVRTTIRRRDQISLSRSETQTLEAGFHWIESYGIHREMEKGKEVVKGATVVIPSWIYKSVINRKNVLTIDDDYFLMKGGLERVLYLIARKHVGRQKCYSLSMRQLHKKTGSERSFNKFSHDIRKLVERNGLPEYYMMLSPKYYKVMCEGHSIELPKYLWEQEAVTFWNREKLDFSTLP